MERAIVLHLNGSSPTVTAPKIAENFDNGKAETPRPWCYLISQLTDKDLGIILKDGFIANQHAALHVIPFNPDPSHYIGRIKNLTIDANLHKSVVELIQKSISEDSTAMHFISDFLMSYHDLIPHPVFKSGNATNWTIGSIRAYNIQCDGQIGKENTQWKWYIHTPTRVQEQVEHWINTLAKITFDAGIYGVGETITYTNCTRCKSTNHNDTECPFTKRSQFVLPQPTKTPNNNTGGGGRGKKGNNSGNDKGKN
jgi:hypothetical protein